MSSDQSKSPAEQQPTQPPSVPGYPPPYNGAHFAPLPPGTYPPPYYTYAPIPDPNHDPNAPNGAAPVPYLMAFAPPPPPGMVYAYAPPPPPGQGMPYSYPPPPPAPAAPVGPPAPRPKRKQVKMACTNCANACKRCDDHRPCERCMKYGIGDSCVDGVRKERKKGIKRGPYKRKSKTQNGEVSYPGLPELPPAPSSAEQPAEGAAQPAPGSYATPPEGYYPYFYPHSYLAPPPAPGPDGQASGEGANNANGHSVPHPPYYPLHPAVYPYPPYTHPPPLAYAAPPHALMAAPPTTPEANGKTDDAATSKGKKRVRPGKGDEGVRTKKTKEFHVEPDTTNGYVGNGVGHSDLSSHGQPVNGTSINGNDQRSAANASI